MTSGDYIPRLADPVFTDYVAHLPAVLVTGPRAAGKTTMCRRAAGSVLHLDEPGTAAAVAAGPDALLRSSQPPVLIDEWQEVPSILGAVKRWVDEDPTPGRVILTGSVAAPLNAGTWPGTGRIVTIDLLGLTRREIEEVTAPPWIDRVVAGDLSAFPAPPRTLDLTDYVSVMFESGFPEAVLRLSGDIRRAWLDAYVDRVIHRDIAALARRRDPARLQRWLRATALLTASSPNLTTITAAAAVDRRTGQAYDDVLERLYLLELLPAWHTNRVSRLTSQPKRHVTDVALAASAAGLEPTDVLRDGNLLGAWLETFVVAQLLPESRLRRPRTQLHHLRTRGGDLEVDVIVELGGARILAVEVKAAGSVGQRDARHLRSLRHTMGDDFIRGIVLHTGVHAYELDDRIWALPISTLWS
jgi:predicted AAA+ superfamily ATPase